MSYAGAAATTQYYASTSTLKYYIPYSLKTVVLTDETKIGYGAFSGCKDLKTMVIPSSVMSIGISAFSGCRGLTTVVIPSSVTSVGNSAFNGCSSISCVTVPGWKCNIDFSSVTNLVIAEGVTSVKRSAFAECSGLVSVTIPSSVMRVEDGAFSGCTGLTRVDIMDLGKWCEIEFESFDANPLCFARHLYLNGEEIRELVLPEGVRNVGSYAFYGCASLMTVEIPTSVTSIGNDAFVGCTGLGDGVIIRDGCVLCVNDESPDHAVIPEGVRVIAGGAFRDCCDLVSVTLPSSLRSIGAEAFRGCTSLERVALPEGLEDVGEGAFRDCTWIQEVEFPSSLTNIGKMAFANCSMLDRVECFDGLESVGEGAFSNCWRMLSVALPVTVDEIGERAFYNCKNVLGVSVPAHVDTIAHLFPSVYQTLQSVAIAEGESELAAGFFSGCKMLQEIALSNAIQEIPDSTFEGCSELLWVLAPSELVRIGNRAFYGCGKLTSMELSGKGGSAFSGRGHVNVFEFSDNLMEIGDDAFNGLPKILNIVCPASVKKIGARAFKGVWDDAEIKLPEGLESLGADAFADCPSIRNVSLPVVETPIKSAFPAAYLKIETVKILGSPEVITKDFCRDVTKLTAIQIPASVTNIEIRAFSGLTNLAAIELPLNLRKIGTYAFNGNSRLSAVSLPQSVETVASRAFDGCSNVRTVSCSGELGTLSTLFPSAYSQITSVSINEGTKQLMADLMSGCTNLSDVDLPAGITEIGARAFKNCSALAAFGVPNGVVTLGDDVFYGCTGLTSLSLPEGLENIPSGAFQNCRAISSLVIPASVGYIGANAFSGCTALKSVSYLGSCPQFDSACYSGTPSDLSSYVVFGSRGWDGIPTSQALPESWPTANARAITYWEPNTFEATFDGNGGTPSSSMVVQTTGMTYVLPEENPEMLGARFDGWWTQPVNGGRIKSTTKVEVTRVQTFYAHWKYNGYSVRFDANGGIGEMGDQMMTVNTPTELAPNRYLRKGYRFEGWVLSPDGEVAFADGEEVENLSFEHNAVVPLYAVWAEQPWDAADYLNVPGRAFAFDGDAEWVADDEVSHDGIGSMRSGVIAAADEGKKTTSSMQTTVVGTGSGSFWWKVDCEPTDGSDYFDYCAFFVDGTEVAKIAGTEDWGKVDYVVTGEGEHVLKWVFTRDDWDEDESLYENAAWVDEFEWAPTPVTLSFDAGGADGEVPASVTKYAGYEMSLPSPSMLTKDGMVFVGWSDGESVFRSGDAYTFGAVDAVLCAVWEEKTWTLGEAANFTGLTIVTGGDANWTVDLDKNYDGVASIRSGVIGDDQQTWVLIDVEGSGTVAFRTFVSGEFYRGKKCDYLKFEVDGTEEFSSYDADWSNVVVKVSGRGTHTLKWTYLKNASKSAGDDCAWLDEIVWEADAETEVVPTVAELAEVFGEESDVVKGVKDEAQLAAFNQFLKDSAIASASDLSAGQKTWAYQSFKLSEIMTAPRLFDDEPVLKFDDIELNDGNLALTVSLHAGEEAITLAKDKLAERIRVGTSLDAIVETPQVIASPSADGMSLTFTIAPPQGDRGFVRILIE